MRPSLASHLLALLIALAPASVLATSTAPVWVVGQCHAPASTPKDEFLHQVAAQASIWTASTGVEVCGRLATDEHGNWGMTLTTNHSQLACLVVDGLAPQHYTPRAEKFHTHPPTDPSGHVALTSHTRQLAATQGHDLGDLTHIRLSNPQHYSRQDLLNGGGYLAAEGRLLYHEAGQTQDLGSIEPTTPVCDLSR